MKEMALSEPRLYAQGNDNFIYHYLNATGNRLDHLTYSSRQLKQKRGGTFVIARSTPRELNSAPTLEGC